jgi:hypothetical protein
MDAITGIGKLSKGSLVSEQTASEKIGLIYNSAEELD